MMEVCISGPRQGRFRAFNTYAECRSGERCLSVKSWRCRFLRKSCSSSPIAPRGFSVGTNGIHLTNLKLYWLQVSYFQDLGTLFNLIHCLGVLSFPLLFVGKGDSWAHPIVLWAGDGLRSAGWDPGVCMQSMYVSALSAVSPVPKVFLFFLFFGGAGDRTHGLTFKASALL